MISSCFGRSNLVSELRPSSPDRWRTANGGCESWEEYCRRFLGDPAGAFDELIEGVRILQGLGHKGQISEEQARTTAKLGTHCGARKIREENEQVGNTNLVGNTVAYTLARLHRDEPELAARVKAGELSANAAAIEAGWRKKPRTLEKLQKAWIKASPEEKQQFLDWIQGQKI